MPAVNGATAPGTNRTTARPRYVYHLSASPDSFRQPYHLLDVDVIDKNVNDSEVRRQKLPGFDTVQRKILSAGFQAQNKQVNQSAQTTPAIKTNKIVQTCSQTLSDEQIEQALQSTELSQFLSSIFPTVSDELVKNQVFDLFKDDLRVISDDEEESTNQSNNQSVNPPTSSHNISLFHSFHHLALSKHCLVGSVEWHPTRACVAFSLTPCWSFDEWAEHSGEVSLSYILLYDLGSLLHPYCVIKVPGLVSTFKFHPEQPAYIAAGLQTGQCILYQINTHRTKHKHALKQDPSPTSPSGSDIIKPTSKPGSAAGAKGSSSSFLSSLSSSPADSHSSSLLPSPLYALLSNLDRSHGRPVTDIHWLPVNQQVTRKGDMLYPSSIQSAAHSNNQNNQSGRPSSQQGSLGHLISTQFGSMAADGRILYWDMRHLNEPSAAHQSLNQSPTQSSFQKTGSIDAGEFFNSHQHAERDGKWSPLFTQQLHAGISTQASKDASGDSAASITPPVNVNNHVSVSTAFPVSAGITARKIAPGAGDAWPMWTALTEDGEILELDTSSRPVTMSRRTRVHASVGCSLQRSSLLPHLYLSCGESTWALWVHGLDFPAFVSPPCALGYSCAVFSPSRPAVLAAARSDGVVEIWDCLDASHAPAYQFAIGTNDRVTSLNFQSTAEQFSNQSINSLPFLSQYSTSRQYLAAGDSAGKCHIIEMPRPLRRRVGNEEQHMEQFIEREMKRGKFAQARENVKRTGQVPVTPFDILKTRLKSQGSKLSADAAAEADYLALCKETLAATS